MTCQLEKSLKKTKKKVKGNNEHGGGFPQQAIQQTMTVLYRLLNVFCVMAKEIPYALRYGMTAK